MELIQFKIVEGQWNVLTNYLYFRQVLATVVILLPLSNFDD